MLRSPLRAPFGTLCTVVLAAMAFAAAPSSADALDEQGAGGASPISGPTTALVGVPVTFTGTPPDDAPGWTLTWSFGDQTPAETGARVTHTFTATAIAGRLVTLTATNPDGDVLTTTQQVRVRRSPTISIRASQRGALVPTEFTAKSTAITATTPVTVTWDFGDGTPPVTGVAPTYATAHTYAQAGTFLVVVTVAAADGTVLARDDTKVAIQAAKAPAVAVSSAGISIVGLSRSPAIPISCGVNGLIPCTVTATVSDTVQRRLRLASPVLGRLTGNGPLSLPLTRAVVRALVDGRRTVAVRLTATATAPNGLSGTQTTTVDIDRYATTGDCGTIPADVKCEAWRGRQTADGGKGGISHRGWPGITGLRWQVIVDANRGERLTGTFLNDELLGRNGSDVLVGGGGHDVLWGDSNIEHNGSRQRDRLEGGAGNDWLYASHGTNTIKAGPGNDHVIAYYGRGTIDCGPGRDTVRVRGGVNAYRLKGCEKVTRG